MALMMKNGDIQAYSRALFVTRHFPIPALEGALQYSLHLLQLTARISTRVDLLCCPNDMEGEFSARNLQLPENVRAHFGKVCMPAISDKIFTRLPHPALPFATAENCALLRELLNESPDIVVLDHIGSSWALRQVERWLIRTPSGLLWYATHNAERSTRLSLLAMDGGPWARPQRTAAVVLDAWRIERNERRLIKLADVTSSIAEADSRSYREDYEPRRVVTLPPAYFGQPQADTPISDESPRRVCFLGTFIWSLKKANLSAFLRAGGETFARNNIELAIVGWIDGEFCSELELQWPNVNFTGAVYPAQDYLRAHPCRIGVVAEQAGGGFKLKLLDYVFSGLPVFALRHAVAGTPLEHGGTAALFDDMRDLCEGIAAHIDDFDYLNHLRQAALEAFQGYLPQHYDAASLRKALENARKRKASGARQSAL